MQFPSSTSNRKSCHFTVDITCARIITCFIIRNCLLWERIIHYKMVVMYVYVISCTGRVRLWLISVTRFTELHRCAGSCTWFLYWDVSDSFRHKSWGGLRCTRGGGSFGINISSNKGWRRGELHTADCLQYGTSRPKMVPEVPNQNWWLVMGCVDGSFLNFLSALKTVLWSHLSRTTAFIETTLNASATNHLTILTAYNLWY